MRFAVGMLLSLLFFVAMSYGRKREEVLLELEQMQRACAMQKGVWVYAANWEDYTIMATCRIGDAPTSD